MKKKFAMTLAALAFGGFGSVAMAAPTPMTMAQMDNITAGGLVDISNVAVIAPVQANVNAPVGVALLGMVTQTSGAQTNYIGGITTNQGSTFFMPGRGCGC